MLESAQAGLSWLTILKRREGYRKAFVDGEPEQNMRNTLDEAPATTELSDQISK